MKIYIHLSRGARRELDYLLKVGPVKYLQKKLDALNLGGKPVADHSGDHKRVETAEPEDVTYNVADEAEGFINDHMTEIQDVIAKAVKTVVPSEYADRKEYVKAVFNLTGDACLAYLHDVFDDPEISPELSDMITEIMIKDASVIVASAMFIEWGLDQKADGKDAEAVETGTEETANTGVDVEEEVTICE